MRYIVAQNPNQETEAGTRFQTISQAARLAAPGDEILVYPGVYREHVDPARGGADAASSICYRAAIPGTAVISGAEVLTGWERLGGTTWTARVPNSVFGDYNPYATVLFGDWYQSTRRNTAGEVYLDGVSLYEAESVEEVLLGERYAPSWEPECSDRKWFAQVQQDCTVFYANFQAADPNSHCVEINVRRNLFYPTRTGINYITVSGFELRQAATTWAPPTAEQEGAVGPHWSKGWVIENCEVHDSKCVGLSLGKPVQPGNENGWSRGSFKHGTQLEREAVCTAWKLGWSKERIGHHTVRNCRIHHCEQAGIVGHLGAAFCRIEQNHIHHINVKQLILGQEIAGIKLHAAIDTQIVGNRIDHCTRGLWLDWQAQGTRVSRNLFYANQTPAYAQAVMSTLCGEDLFIEVSHGPTVADNNLLLSAYSGRISTQGVAFLHNLICGPFKFIGLGQNNGYSTQVRYTPYHDPHDTTIAGFMSLLHGDMRFYNNIFIQQEFDYARFSSLAGGAIRCNGTSGTHPYDEYPTEKEYQDMMARAPIREAEHYYGPLPVVCAGNAYFNGAQPWKKENAPIIENGIHITLEEAEGRLLLKTDLYRHLRSREWRLYQTEDLGVAMEPQQRFENPDGSDIRFEQDYFGERFDAAVPGPFAVQQETEDASFVIA